MSSFVGCLNKSCFEIKLLFVDLFYVGFSFVARSQPSSETVFDLTGCKESVWGQMLIVTEQANACEGNRTE